jgi:serine/threonine protein kinase
MNEARAMAALAHEHIAVLYEAELWRGTPLLVMEFMGRGTLAAMLRCSPLPASSAIRIVRQLAGALRHVHASGRRHGDIKPSNIGFTEHGVPRFLDFGLSAAITPPAGEHAERSDVLAGTLPYLSPEVRAGGCPGPELDVWALSIVLFESLTGEHPFFDRTFRYASSSPRLSVLDSQPIGAVSVWREYFSGAFARADARYPRSATDLLQALDLLQERITTADVDA